MYYEERTQNVTGGVNPIITQTPRYSKVDANMTIKIRPMVSGDENITLNIEAEFSNFVEPKITNAPPGNATRKFLSQIRVLNEEMVLLGGLDEITKEESGSGFPILSRIPVLKWIFSSRKKASSDNKLIVLIKPQIVY
jgi:type IV pilus assembly protein PilQ